MADPVDPHYQFSVMLEQAKSVTATVIQLGSALLNSLEKKDPEELNLLQSTYEQAILNMTRKIKAQNIKYAEKHMESLQQSLEAARHRQKHYSDLIKHEYPPAEIVQLAQEAAALYLQTSVAVARIASIPGYSAQVIAGTSPGPTGLGDALMAPAQAAEIANAALQHSAGKTATIANFERRKEDWELQQALASYDVQQIQAEVDGAGIQQKITERDLEIHEKNVEQAREQNDFLRKKSNNEDLYQRLAGRLSAVCFQSYKLAFALARSAERSYQYDHNSDQSFMEFGLWDSVKNGLLASEGLMLSLNRLEKAYLDGDARVLEIVKTISLLQLDPAQLLRLKRDGVCTFEFSEQLFDYDFPGHYCRRIKSVSVSIPAVLGPYQNVHATLSQKSDRSLIEPNKELVTALLSGTGLAAAETKHPGVLRSSWRPSQPIAISKGVDDSGMFQLDFGDERYLPFEGTGAISRWELSIPIATNGLDFANISDVIIELRYTALDGGELFRSEVIKNPQVKFYSGIRFLSLRQECSTDWQKAADPAAKGFKLEFIVKPNMFPVNLKGMIHLGEIAQPADQNKIETNNKINLLALPHNEGTKIELQLNSKLRQKGGYDAPKVGHKWSVSATGGKLSSLADIILIVPFAGELDWGTDT